MGIVCMYDNRALVQFQVYIHIHIYVYIKMYRHLFCILFNYKTYKELELDIGLLLNLENMLSEFKRTYIHIYKTVSKYNH